MHGELFSRGMRERVVIVFEINQVFINSVQHGTVDGTACLMTQNGELNGRSHRKRRSRPFRGFAKSSDLSRHKRWQQGADDKKTMP
jgi:hypothetical protein